MQDRSLKKLSIAGCVLVSIFAIIFLISKPFEFGSELHRPILLVASLLIAATVVAFFGLKSAISVKTNERRQVRGLLFIIACIAVSLRAIALFTNPILEIDYYRYLWDGKVSSSGVSPYLYAPSQVLKANPTEASSMQTRGDIALLESMSLRSEANRTILRRVHFGQYTTAYPPVSQKVFELAVCWLPESASVWTHLAWLRLILIAFDLATIGIVILLLKKLNMHLGWVVAYAWNPLVVKEIANSGHLDSVAVFFMVAAVYTVVSWFVRNKNSQSGTNSILQWRLFASAACLGLGVGAKLFPIVLFPAIFITIAKVRWVKALLFASVFALTTAVVMWPIVQHSLSENPERKDGISSFLSKWQMNDVIFSGIYYNVKPDRKHNNPTVSTTPWFVVTPNESRVRIHDWVTKMTGSRNPAFAISRMVTMTAFMIFYVWQIVVLYRDKSSLRLERLTWILAVFLFLQPTVNPWYWVWVAPLACFSRNRAWLIVSGLLLIYYVRFWFKANASTQEFAGTTYTAVGQFDHIVAWIEFAMIVGVLVFSYVKTSQHSNSTNDVSKNIAIESP